MSILECTETEIDSGINVGDRVLARMVRRDEEKSRGVFNLISANGKPVGLVYWKDSGEIYRCCWTGVKFKEIK